MTFIKNLLSGSLLFRWLTAASEFLDRQWEKSWLSAALSEQKERTEDGSIFPRLLRQLHLLLCRLFRLIHLDSLLEGSVFRNAFLWSALAAAVTPLVPTMWALAAVLAAYGALFLDLGANKSLTLPYSPESKWILGYAFVYAFSTFFSPNRAGNLRGAALTVVFVLFALVLFMSLRSKRQIKALTSLLVLAGFAVSLYGLWQVFSGAENLGNWVDSGTSEEIGLRVYSTLENPNVLAEYLILIIPLAVASVINAETPNGRLAAVIAAGAMTVVMVLTYSRGGWLGLIFAAALFLVMLDRRFIVVGLIGAVALLFVLPQSITSRLFSIGNLADSSLNYRSSIWMGTLRMLQDYWLSGIGTGSANFKLIYPLYSYHAAVAEHSHCLYLQVIAENGIVGLFVFLGLLVSALRNMATQIRRSTDKKRRIALMAVLSGLGGFLVQSFVEHSFYNYRVQLMFWIVLALGMALANRKEAAED